jgi:U32 family peptidase
MKIPELLAPAATFACAKAAFDHGADAVYAGLTTHNLRARGANFDVEQLDGLCCLAHDLGKRVYVALNVMPNDSMIADIESCLKSFAGRSCRPDAFIVGDPGVVSLCKRYAPDVSLHLSTQTGTFNIESAGFWARFGVTRVILPREMTLDSIQKITASGPVETEVFIHGAMCVSVSGRCLLGAYMERRHPNFGDCPQPCRFRYMIAPVRDTAAEGAKQGQAAEWYTVEEEPPGVALILNSKDLSALPVLDRIVSSGVAAVKIEGRHRSLHYVASVVKVYRAALDRCAAGPGPYAVLPQWQEELDRLDHRPYTTGFYAGEYFLQDVADSRKARDYRIVGVVRDQLDGKGAVVDVKNPFLPLDTLSVLSARPGTIAHDVTVLRMTDVNGHETGKALTNRLVVCTTHPMVHDGDILRKKQPEG